VCALVVAGVADAGIDSSAAVVEAGDIVHTGTEKDTYVDTLNLWV